MSKPDYRPQTLALHAGYDPDPTTGSRAVPIYHTASYVFRDSEHAAARFALSDPGPIYTRITNPTADVLEKRLAALEEGQAGLALASGQAAETLALLSILRPGDELISGTGVYGGTYNLLANSLGRLRIQTRFVDHTDPQAFADAITPKTRAIYLESLPNPSLIPPDFEAIAAIARDAQIPLIVDNTAASPALVRPLSVGANIVVNSCTKYIGGHGTGIGGAIVDGGSFDWANGKFPEFTEPHPGYHGLQLKDLGALAFILRARIEGLRDFGACISPFNAHGFIQGLETLHLRVERHSRNALALATWLEQHPKVAWVRYPGLKGDPGHATAKRYFTGGFGGLLTFGVKGGLSAGRQVADNTQLFSLLANIGDTRSLIIHPASTTHQQLTPEQQESTGVTQDLLRLSVGLEHIEDLVADLDQALAGL